ncbi:hypothetical protein GT148_004193 [Salmonella enterica]|nr:hypothetical protein [Salmonella enterica]
MLIESAVSAGVNLIFFPELSLTGYEPEMAKDLALADESSLSPLQVLSDRYDRGPLGKRKISYAKPVFCTDYYPLSVTSGIYPVPT